MHFSLTLLGTGAAMPSTGRFPSAHQVSVHGRKFLLDCGEGTQYQLHRYGSGAGSISHIFITHLHGDHCFGLPGLLSSYQLLGRTAPLRLFGPEGLDAMLDAVWRHTYARLDFELIFRAVEPGGSETIWEDDALEVLSLPLDHRVPTIGYLIREKPRPRTMRPGVVERFRVPYEQIESIKRGAPFRMPDGRLLPNDELTLPPPAARSLAYCTDTRYHEALLPHLQGVDLLYHEATFCEDARERAEQTGHSTAAQAAHIARQAGVRRLVLGHFSSRYEGGDVFEAEARAIFPNTLAGADGMQIDIPYEGRRGM